MGKFWAFFWEFLDNFMGNFGHFYGEFWDIFIGNVGYFYGKFWDIFMGICTFQGNLLEFLGERYWYNNRNPIWIYWASEVIPMYVFLKPSHCPDQPRCVRVSQSGPSWAPLGAPFHSLTHLLDIFMEKNIFKGNFWTCLGILHLLGYWNFGPVGTWENPNMDMRSPSCPI